MRCDLARQLSSQALDDPLGPATRADLDRHLASCSRCRSFDAELARVRQRLRVQAVGEVPDVAGAVVTRLREELGDEPPSVPRPAVGGPRRPRTWLVAAAALVVAYVSTVGVLGLDRDPAVFAAELPERLREPTAPLTSLHLSLTVTERWGAPGVDERSYTGDLHYAAPETLVLDLADRTSYPSDTWRPNDTMLVVDEGTVWSSGLARCPVAALPDCIPSEPTVTALRGTAPFTDGAPRPAEVVRPAAAFVEGSSPPDLGAREIAGREAVGTSLTVAEAAPLLDALTAAGNWRELYPADAVELWLDREHLFPLELTVRADDGADRARWAAARRHADPPGEPILRLTADDVDLDDPVDVPAIPAVAEVTDAGFVGAQDVDVPVPDELPDGFRAHRSGTIRSAGAPSVAVRSWTDGSRWLRITTTRKWAGPSLFGDLQPVPRPVTLGTGPPAYEVPGRVAIHGRDLDLVVAGDLPQAELRHLAASLDVEPAPVPSRWSAAQLTTVEQAADVAPGLLTLEDDAYGAPAARLLRDGVAIAYPGGGDRWVELVQLASDTLSPPLAAEVIGVGVRGATGRYTPSRGELEWVEGGRVRSLRSTSLGLDELLDLAARLEPAP